MFLQKPEQTMSHKSVYKCVEDALYADKISEDVMLFVILLLLTYWPMGDLLLHDGDIIGGTSIKTSFEAMTGEHGSKYLLISGIVWLLLIVIGSNLSVLHVLIEFCCRWLYCSMIWSRAAINESLKPNCLISSLFFKSSFVKRTKVAPKILFLRNGPTKSDKSPSCVSLSHWHTSECVQFSGSIDSISLSYIYIQW